MPSQKSLLIGLDSIHSDLVREAVADGAMPFVARLISTGSWHSINFEIPFSRAFWASLHTGVSAGRHGIYAFDQLVPGGYRFAIKPAFEMGAPTYWQRLGEAGKKILILNPPEYPPVDGMEGRQVSGWRTHMVGNYLHEAKASHPPDLLEAVKKRFPGDPMKFEDWGVDGKLDVERCAKAIGVSLEEKAEVFASWMEDGDWDHGYIVLDDLHVFLHMCWHIRSGEQAHYSGAPVYSKGDPARGCLAALDRALARLVEGAGPDATVMTVGLGGIGRGNIWSPVVDEMIDHIEGVVDGRHDVYSRLAAIWPRLPHWLTSTLLSLKTRVREKLLAPRRSGRRCFAMPLNENSGGIRINLKGREESGVVAPGAEFDEVCQELSEALLGLQCTRTGAPLITDVIQITGTIEGPRADHLPDLAIVWNSEQVIAEVQSPTVGPIKRSVASRHTGEHLVDGFLLANGPRIAQGERDDPISIVDIAPTVAALHGISDLDDFCGTPITRIAHARGGQQ